MRVEVDWSRQHLFSVNDSPTIYQRKWNIGLKVHSGHFVNSKDLTVVISSDSEEMPQPPIPLNVSLFSAYHLGGVAVTSGFEDYK